MKKNVFILRFIIILMSIHPYVYSQQNNDSVSLKNLTLNLNSLESLIHTSLIKTPKDTTCCAQKELYASITNKTERRLISALIILPIALTLLTILWLLTTLRRDKTFFNSLFAEKTSQQTLSTTSTPGSSSRAIMFASGLMAIIVSSVVVAFYIYYYLLCHKGPEMRELLFTLLALGIGVVPYAINKLKQ